MNEYRYRGLSMLKSKILRYSRKTGEVPEPGEPEYPETVYRVTVYGHSIAEIFQDRFLNHLGTWCNSD